MNNQEELASEKKSEQKSHFLVGEGQRQLSGTRKGPMREFVRLRLGVLCGKSNSLRRK